MPPWNALCQGLVLSGRRLGGPASRRLQQRRQRLLQQQAEQRTPSPKATPAASAVPFMAGGRMGSDPLHLNDETQQQQQGGPPKRVGTGHFRDPMRAPVPVEGGNPAHTEFLNMNKQDLQARVVEQLIALRRQKQQQQQQQPQQQQRQHGEAAPQNATVHAPPETAQREPRDSDLPLAVADVYVHHEQNIRSVAPRPHAFVEACVRDLMAGASAAANPLYTPSIPLGEEWGEERPFEYHDSEKEKRATRPSEAQLRRAASLVGAPGVELVHAETEAALLHLKEASQGICDPSFKGAPDEPNGSSTAFKTVSTEAAARSDGQNAEERIDRWGAPRESPYDRRQGAPSVVLAGSSRQLRSFFRSDDSPVTCRENPCGVHLPAVEECPHGSPLQTEIPEEDTPRASMGRARRRTSNTETTLLEVAGSPLLGETIRASEESSRAWEAVLGASSAAAPVQTPSALAGDSPGDVHYLPSDPFSDNPTCASETTADGALHVWGLRFRERGTIDCRSLGVVMGGRGRARFAFGGGCFAMCSLNLSTLGAYWAARRSSCLFDVSYRRLLEVRGRDRVAFADLLASCDMQRMMRVGEAYSALLLDSKGLLMDDCCVLKAPDFIEIRSSGHAFSQIFEYVAELANFCTKSGMQVALQPSSKSCVLALQGPLAMKRFVQQCNPRLLTVVQGVAALHAAAPKLARTLLFGVGNSGSGACGWGVRGEKTEAPSRGALRVALYDFWGNPLSPAGLSQLPFMSAWRLEIRLPRDPNIGSRSHSSSKKFSVSCIRGGPTGEDGIEFAADPPGALALARFLLDDSLARKGPPVQNPGGLGSSVVAPPYLGSFFALEMLRLEAGLPWMGTDMRSSHTAPQAGFARLVSLYKVRQKVLLGSEALSRHLAVPPNVRRVGFIIGGNDRLLRAEQIQQERQEAPAEGDEAGVCFAVSSGTNLEAISFPLCGSAVLSRGERRPVGIITSVGWSPTMKCRIAQGLVLNEFARHREPVWFAVPKAVSSDAPKWKKEKLLRGRRLRLLVPGRVCRLPLLPHNYPLVRHVIHNSPCSLPRCPSLLSLVPKKSQQALWSLRIRQRDRIRMTIAFEGSRCPFMSYYYSCLFKGKTRISGQMPMRESSKLCVLFVCEFICRQRARGRPRKQCHSCRLGMGSITAPQRQRGRGRKGPGRRNLWRDSGGEEDICDMCYTSTARSSESSPYEGRKPCRVRVAATSNHSQHSQLVHRASSLRPLHLVYEVALKLLPEECARPNLRAKGATYLFVGAKTVREVLEHQTKITVQQDDQHPGDHHRVNYDLHRKHKVAVCGSQSAAV
ncbi:uncharacterized protein LOC34622214 [Cyclospora cayetanensis]|uniref:Uncharacterized protein LOC34622214 n=1 Tax=Cyclospora cayetanensis TaxID=88456 RepID=A0A6P6RTI5_9EIME|nr:uncharacterized protein LOC34622214 [Cyclospora cayetanensis]